MHEQFSLAYRVHEIERHLHSYERWMELAGTPAGETHRADAAGNWRPASFKWMRVIPFTAHGYRFLGSSDTPIITGSAKYDMHSLIFTAAERNLPYVVQVAFGATGAAALTAGTYTEAVFVPASNVLDTGPVHLQCRRIAAGTKAWARCICPGQRYGNDGLYDRLA